MKKERGEGLREGRGERGEGVREGRGERGEGVREEGGVEPVRQESVCV